LESEFDFFSDLVVVGDGFFGLAGERTQTDAMCTNITIGPAAGAARLRHAVVAPVVSRPI